MFGTLVSTDLDRCTLEYIENPDHVAAVSRNVQDKIRIACVLCRSRKARCSGRGKRCQRCVAMGLECVYPENQAQNKRQEKNKSRRAAIERNVNVGARIICNEATRCDGNDQVRYGGELALNDLNDNMLDEGYIGESIFTPWIMDTPVQHSLDDDPSSSSSSNPSSVVGLIINESSSPATSRSATVASPGQLLEIPTADMSSTSQVGLPAADGAGDLEYCEGPDTVHSDITWAMNADEHGTLDTASEQVSLEPWSKSRTESDNRCCLLRSIAFLERLAFRSTSRKDRIDLLLADFRNSMETLGVFMACKRCESRIDQNMLLVMAARQISVICGKMASSYKAMHVCRQGHKSSSQQKPELDAASGVVEIFVSTYRVNRHETLHLLESLVTLQIAELQQHIDTIKSRCRNWPDQGQTEALDDAERKIESARIAIRSHS